MNGSEISPEQCADELERRANRRRFYKSREGENHLISPAAGRRRSKHSVQEGAIRGVLISVRIVQIRDDFLECGAPDFAKAPSWPVPNAGPRRRSKSEGGRAVTVKFCAALTPVRQAQGPEPFRQAQGPSGSRGKVEREQRPPPLVAASSRGAKHPLLARMFHTLLYSLHADC